MTETTIRELERIVGSFDPKSDNPWRRLAEHLLDPDFDGPWMLPEDAGELTKRGWHLEPCGTWKLGLESNAKAIYPCVPAEPWYGNPLSDGVRVIVLGDLPVYDDFTNRIQRRITQTSNVTMLTRDLPRRLVEWMCLFGDGFYNSQEPVMSPGINLMDGYCSLRYRHWIKEVTELFANGMRVHSLEDVLTLNAYYRFAIVNATPYYASSAEPLIAGLLPYHEYVKKLICWLALRTDVVFVAPSANIRQAWSIILGDAYSMLIEERRLFKCASLKTLSFAAKRHI